MEPRLSGWRCEVRRGEWRSAPRTEASERPPGAGFSCGEPSKKNGVSARPWNGWSPDVRNTRFQRLPGMAARQAAELRPRWAFVIPEVSTAASQPSVVDGVLYFGTWNGTVYALDVRSGCLHWRFAASAGVRAAITIVGTTAIFGDLNANVYAVDIRDGSLRWRQRVDDHAWARITGSPVAHKMIVYVPVSSLESVAAANPNYLCCSFRGSIVALEVNSGKQLWKTHMIESHPPSQSTTNRAGSLIIGPAGAAVWSAPTVDEKRGVLYVGTGNSYTGIKSSGADSIHALSLFNGKRQWAKAMLPADNFNAACLTEEKVNCPDPEGPDFDFGASPVLVSTRRGRDLLLAGQKSGVLYAMDPNRAGEFVWEVRLGRGGKVGGIQWGMAADDDRVYVAVADWNAFDGLPAAGAIAAIDLETGAPLWRVPNPSDACTNRPPVCATAYSAAVTAIPGAVFAGSVDGRFRVHNSMNGEVIWEFDTYGEVVGLNGSVGRGGSINAAGTTVADGMAYQTSGYGHLGFGMPGNVLFAFGISASPREEPARTH